MIRKIDDEQRCCILIVYCTGHSVTIRDGQTILCDSNDKNEVLFNMGLKLMTLTEAYENLNVFANYNCSRQYLENVGGLATAR